MKRIEAVVRRSEFGSFCQCAGELGIFGFDLSEAQRTAVKVDFAVGDTEVTQTVHAVLAHAHPDSIGVFELDNESLEGPIRLTESNGPSGVQRPDTKTENRDE